MLRNFFNVFNITKRTFLIKHTKINENERFLQNIHKEVALLRVSYGFDSRCGCQKSPMQNRIGDFLLIQLFPYLSFFCPSTALRIL